MVTKLILGLILVLVGMLSGGALFFYLFAACFPELGLQAENKVRKRLGQHPLMADSTLRFGKSNLLHPRAYAAVRNRATLWFIFFVLLTGLINALSRYLGF